MKVADVMTSDVVSVGPEAPIRDVAAILVSRRISGLPVVSELGAVLGVVSEGDILVKERPSEPRGALARLLHQEQSALTAKEQARTAGEAMTAPALTIAPDRPVAAAARLMVDEGINRLPVVEGDRLVGIVTRADLVSAFARPDEAIVREIREEVMRRALWMPDAAQVTSRRGEVRLRGRVEREADADVLTELVRRVPGVVSVEAELTWPDDDRRR